MFIGIARFELFLPTSGSLKDKRQVLRPVIAAVQNKFNVSIAEIDYQDLWQRTALGISCVSSTGGQCRKVLQEVEKTIGRFAIEGAEIIDRDIQIIGHEDL